MPSQALFFATDTYLDSSIPNLQCAVNDARALQAVFEHRLGYEGAAHCVESPTRDQVFDELFKLRPRLQPGDTLLMYFAGHGVEDPRTGNQHLLLARAEYDMLWADLIDDAPGTVSIKALVSYTNKFEGVHRVMVLDACREELRPSRSLGGAGVLFGREESLNHLAQEVAAARNAGLRQAPATNTPALAEPPVFLKACNSRELAFELLGERRGAFSLGFQHALQEAQQQAERLREPVATTADFMQAVVRHTHEAARRARHPVQQQPWMNDGAAAAVLYRPAPRRVLAPDERQRRRDTLEQQFERCMMTGHFHEPADQCAALALQQLVEDDLLDEARLLHHQQLLQDGPRLQSALSVNTELAWSQLAASASHLSTRQTAQRNADELRSQARKAQAQAEQDAAQRTRTEQLQREQAEADARRLQQEAADAAAAQAAEKLRAQQEAAQRLAAEAAAKQAREQEAQAWAAISALKPKDAAARTQAEVLCIRYLAQFGSEAPHAGEVQGRRDRWAKADGAGPRGRSLLWAGAAVGLAGGVYVLAGGHRADVVEAAKPTGPTFRRMEPQLQVVGCSACGEMAVVPGGEFDMGSTSEEKESLDSERPVRQGVQVAGFEIGRTEVTQGQWKAVMGSNPSSFKACGDTCPVENVSWNDIAGPGGFLEKLKEKTGQQYRLPTEAEWEYAARAGSKGPYWWGGTIHSGQANYAGKNAYAGGGSKGEYRQTTVKADAFEANAWGLYNVHGNVWEWVQDGWHDNYQGAPMDGRDWVDGADKARRVVRGGAWNDYPWDLRSAYRNRYSQDIRYIYTGFRLARTF